MFHAIYPGARNQFQVIEVNFRKNKIKCSLSFLKLKAIIINFIHVFCFENQYIVEIF